MNKVISFYITLFSLAASLWLLNSPTKPVPTTYYVTPDISLATVSGYALKAGDQVLFQKGGVWKGKLSLDGRIGDHGNNIVIGSYGSGANPVIGTRTSLIGWDTASNWTLDTTRGSNVYRFTGWYRTTYLADGNPNIVFIKDHAHRMWLSGKEAPRGGTNSSNLVINSRYPASWLKETWQIYVWAPSNPASYYTNIEWGGEITSTISAIGAQHITIQDLDLRGSMGSIIDLSNVRDITIQNNLIGEEADHIGIHGRNRCDTVTIINNIIDAKDTCKDQFIYQQGLQDGVAMNSGCHNWTVMYNKINNWGHSCVEFTDIDTDTVGKNKDGLTCSNIKVWYNDLDGSGPDYLRPFGFDSRFDHSTSGVTARYNRVNNFTVRSQVETNNADFSYNVISNVTTCKSYGVVSDAGAGLMINPYNYTNASNMTIIGNTFVNIDEAAIIISNSTNAAYGVVTTNVIANNVALNCGRAATTDYGLYYVSLSINPTSGGSKIHDNTFYNNHFYNATNTSRYAYDSNIGGSASFMTKDQFNAYNGGVLNNTISGNQTGDPLFVSSTNFEPQTSSPLIGHGYNIGNSHSSAIQPGSSWPSLVTLAPQGAAWNIGSYATNNPVIGGFIIRGKRIKLQ